MLVQRLSALLLGLSATQAALADEPPAWLTERRIIGENNLEPIEATRNTDTYERERIVARVEELDGSGFCTASRLSGNIFLTNFHCFEYKPCDQIQFHLGYEKELRRSEQLIYKCKEVISKDLNLDYALYRVELVGALPDGETKTHDFAVLDLAIPDNDRAGVEKTFAIPQEGKILDMKVALKVTHPYVGDLTVKLTSPEGTEVVLQDGVGGDADNIDKTYTFQDGLSAFANQVAKGDWKLKIVDAGAGDAGKLDSISFTITAAAAERAAPSESKAMLHELMGDYPTGTLWAGDIHVDQLLTVASHPAARLKEIDRSANCKLRTIETEVVAERTTITHTCDTEGGSSGSPVLDRETGNIVALHWGGTDEYNLAIPMSLIVKHLQETLAPEVFAELSVRR